MLQKRRLTVQPVDAAQFCGRDNSMVVSFLNGIDHLVLDPAATDEDEAQPLPSCVVSHTYTGARLTDATVDTQREFIAEAAINNAAVVACRVTPLTASKADPTAACPVRSLGPSKIVFFAGCQRLAEVRLGADVVDAAAADVDAATACPMQCFRVESPGASEPLVLDIAAFMDGLQTLCTCTPQLGKLQTMRFDDHHVCCMGPGRVGKTEVTVVLSSGVAVLCGLLNAPPSNADDGSDAMNSDEQHAPTPASATLNATAFTEAARRAFAAANERSNLRILHTIQLPAAQSTSSTEGGAATAALPAPKRVAWSGASTLWVLYADGSVVVVQCTQDSATAGSMLSRTQDDEELHQGQQLPSALMAHEGEGEEPPTETTMSVKHVLQTQLVNPDGQRIPIELLHVNADLRAPVLHVAFTSGTGTDGRQPPQLYYGTAFVSGGACAVSAGSSGSGSPSVSVQWRLQWMTYNEQLYGVRFERGRYHILTQDARGRGPLYIAVLPRCSPVHNSQTGVAAERASLAAAIMASPESELSRHCSACENFLRELHAAAQRLSSVDNAEALLHQLMQAQHALYALLSRQHQSLDVADLAPSDSLPYRLLQRASRLHRQLSTYVLLLRLGIIGTVAKPVHKVLRLEEAASISKAAQAQWSSVMRDTFRSGSVYQSAVSELAMWQSPAPLCVELLLSRLGLTLGDASCNMAAVLRKMDSLTPEYALFILYYSYQAMGCAGDAHVVVPPVDVQQRQLEWRESFLLLFGQSIELNAWAFACYAVDHGFNPAERRGDAADAPMQYVLGSAVHHLGVPPFSKLLAPLLNGLAHVAALDVLLHLAPSCLAAYSAAMESVPVSVTMRLLCVAVRAGSHRVIEALYDVLRGTPLLQDLAAQPLAFAALDARDISGLRGWVEVGSCVAATIERTLQTSDDIHRRESVLVAYYVLLQRYEDALRVCTAATAANATQAQRLQVVLSYLRSLLSVSSAVWGEGNAGVAASADMNLPLLPLDSAVQYPWSQTALAAPLLETSTAALSEDLRRATAAASAADRGSSQKLATHIGTGGVTGRAASSTDNTGQQPHQQQLYSGGGGGIGGSAAPNAKPALFRPSTLLLSVERSAGSRDASSPSPGSTANQVSGR